MPLSIIVSLTYYPSCRRGVLESHRDVYMDEVAKNLSCPRMGCRYVGAKITLIKKRGNQRLCRRYAVRIKTATE